MKTRPNSNYILQIMRDGDMDDPWGTAMAWAFAVCETLAVIGADVPEELQYRPSPYVALESPETYEPESYEDDVVWEYLLGGKVIQANDTLFSERVSQVQFAGRCLHRYIGWCKEAGKDY